METHSTRPAPAFLVLLAFLAVYIVWGTTYLAIVYGLKGFPPFLLSALRYLIAGSLLLGWCLIRGLKIPPAAVIRTCVISGLLMLIGGTGLASWAEQYVGSGEVAIIIASEPFWFVLIDKKRWHAYFNNPYIIAGLVIGFIGIVLFFRYSGATVGIAANMQWIGYAVVVLGAILWVVGSLYAERRLDGSTSNIVVVCIQLLAAGIGSLLISGITGELRSFSFPAVPLQAWGGLLYLVIMGSLVAYMAFTWLITVRPPALVSTHTYINPLVAVLMGWAFVNEQFSRMQLLTMFIILAGVLLTNFPSYKAFFKK